jgi:hypothetical protein
VLSLISNFTPTCYFITNYGLSNIIISGLTVSSFRRLRKNGTGKKHTQCKNPYNRFAHTHRSL